MPTYNDYGIVLSSYNLAESDKILNIYTKENGLVRAIAKGVKKLKSRFTGKVDQLSCCYFHFAKGKNLDIVSDCSQVTNFPLLRSDLIRLTYGILFLEIVNSFAHEMESESTHIYDLLYNGLQELQKIDNPAQFSIEFILEFLSIHGLNPQLETCVSCSKEISFVESIKDYPYSYILGGLLCKECSGFIDFAPVNLEAIEILEGKILFYSKTKSKEQRESSTATLNKPILQEKIYPALNLLKEHINIRAKNKINSFDLVFSL